MKIQIQQLVTQALEQLANEDVLPADPISQPNIERTREAKHGDYACNIAMILAKTVGMRPPILTATASQDPMV